MQAAFPSNATRSTLPFSEFPNLFSPGLAAIARRLVPSALYNKLDPFEAAIQTFVQQAAAGIPTGAMVLDAGAGEGRFRPLFDRASYVGIDFAQGDPSWDYSNLDVIGRLEKLPFS